MTTMMKLREQTLSDAVRARPYTPAPSSKRDNAIEEAARYAELRPDAQQHAKESKESWQKLHGKLDRVKEEHQEWRQEHKISSWLHDKGVWKNGTLEKHEAREQRYVSHEAKAYDQHMTAKEEVQRLDSHLARAQDEARKGWAEQDKPKQSQSTSGGSRSPSQHSYQNHEALTHTAGTMGLAGGRQAQEQKTEKKPEEDPFAPAKHDVFAPAPKPDAPAPQPSGRTLAGEVAKRQEFSRSPFAQLDSPEANQPDPKLQPEALGQKRRMRP